MNNGFILPAIAGGAVTGRLIVKKDGQGRVVPAGAGPDQVVGVSDIHAQCVAGDRISIHATAGLAEVIASAAIPFGARVSASAGGKAKVAAAGDHVIGIAWTDAEADGDYFKVLLAPHKL